MISIDLASYAPASSEMIVEDRDSPVSVLLHLLLKHRPDVFIHSIRVGTLYNRLSSNYEGGRLITRENLAGVLLHDIGKLGVPSHLLYKAGRLGDEEYQQVKLHTIQGKSIAQRLIQEPQVLELIESHHERWDGQGYPKGRCAEEVPSACRLLSICDAIEAMTADRVYKQKMSHEACREELARQSGRQFDPHLTNWVLSRFDEVADLIDSLSKVLSV